MVLDMEWVWSGWVVSITMPDVGEMPPQKLRGVVEWRSGGWRIFLLLVIVVVVSLVLIVMVVLCGAGLLLLLLRLGHHGHGHGRGAGDW